MSKFILMLMENNSGYYYAARDAFVDATLTPKAADVAKMMFRVENDYILYYYTGTEEYKSRLETSLSSLKSAYQLLKSNDLASFECLSQVYATLLENCDQIF